MKTIFTYLVIMALPFIVFSQTSELENTIGGANPDAGFSVFHSINGYWLTGYTESTGAGMKDCYIMELDYNGNPMWTTTTGTTGNDAINSSVEYNITYVSGGYTNGNGKDYYMAEYNYDGTLKYTAKSYDNGYGDDEITKVKDFGNGYINAVGYVTNSNYDKDFLLCLYYDDNLDFDTVNLATYGGTGDEVAYDIVNGDFQNPSNRLAVGYTTSWGAGGQDILAFCYVEDQYGALLSDTVFSRTYGGSGDECGISAIYDYFYTEIFLVGYTTSYGAGGKDIYLLALDNAGNTLWTKTYGYTNDDVPTGIIEENDTTLTIYGYTTNEVNSDKDFYILTVKKSNGDVIYEDIWGDSGVDEAINDIYLDMCQYVITGEKNGDVYFALRNRLKKDIIISDVSCNGLNDGSIELIPYNLMPANYELIWYDTAMVGLDTNNLILDTLSEGYYIMYLYDYGTSCSYIDTFQIAEPLIMNYTGFATPAACGGACDGQVQVNITGGVPPYTYFWDAGTGYQTTSTADGLCTGTYNVTVTDANGCSITDNYFVDELAMAYISGFVNATSYGNVPDGYCQALLLKQEGTADWDTMAIENLIASQYWFQDVYPGNYLIKFELDSSLVGFDNVLDTYHDSSYTWGLATPLTVNCEDTISLITSMFEMTPTGNGNGTISGFIGYNNGTKNSGEPVPGAEVYIEQEPNDQPILSSETDTSGYYEFEDIAMGANYFLVVDIPGFPQITTYNNINITSSDTLYTNLNFYVDTTTGNEGIYIDDITQINKHEQLICKVYPNPFFDFLNVEFGLEENDSYNLQLLDMTGKVIYEDINTGAAGEIVRKQITVPGSGSYLIKLQINDNVYLKKVIAN